MCTGLGKLGVRLRCRPSSGRGMHVDEVFAKLLALSTWEAPTSQCWWAGPANWAHLGRGQQAGRLTGVGGSQNGGTEAAGGSFQVRRGQKDPYGRDPRDRQSQRRGLSGPSSLLTPLSDRGPEKRPASKGS